MSKQYLITEKHKQQAFDLTSMMQGVFLNRVVVIETIGGDSYDKEARE